MQRAADLLCVKMPYYFIINTLLVCSVLQIYD